MSCNYRITNQAELDAFFDKARIQDNASCYAQKRQPPADFEIDGEPSQNLINHRWVNSVTGETVIVRWEKVQE